MRTIGKLTMAFGLVAALGLPAAPAKAQTSRLGMTAIIGPEGRKELNLTEDQIAKIREVMEKQRETIGERNRGLLDLSPNERPAKFQEMIKEVNAVAEKELKDILEGDQFERYRQVTLQVNTINAFRQEDVVKKLELTDDQKSKIEAIMADVREEMREMRGSREEARKKGDRQAAVFGKLQEIRQKAKERAVAVLTDEQRERWKGMVGKEFKFEMGPPLD